MPSRRMVLGTLASAAIGAACRAGDPTASPERTLADSAERYVRVALQLAQHQPDLVEAYLGPADWRPGPRVPVAGLLREVVAIDDALSRLAADGMADATLRDRTSYLTGQVRGLRTAARRLTGESMRFADEARDGFGLEWSPRSSEAAERARRDLEALLPGNEPLPSRYAAFRQQHALAPELVLPVFRAAIAECRARVAAHLRLPDGESLAVEALEGGGFEARAIYMGGYRTRVALSSTGPTDLVRLVRLAAHETYPGHHVQHLFEDRDVVRGRGWTERTLLPAYGPHVLAAEGAAEAGVALLLDRATLTEVCASLAPAARTPIEAVADLAAVHLAERALEDVVPLVAQAYLDGAIGSEAAIDRLRNEALVPDPPQLLAAIERQRTRILAYPLGRQLAIDQVFARPVGERWAALQAAATLAVLLPGVR